MFTLTHHFSDLFAQLGLPTDSPGIRQFLSSNTPLAGHISLHEATCWTPAQASFLQEALLEDSDWAEVVDQLNKALREI